MGVYSADSASLCTRDSTLLGSSLAEKGGQDEDVLQMMNRSEEREGIT